jgi:serine/threonine-protein kinase
MGDVFEAWDTILGRLVALKVLTRIEPAAMIRFMNEAQLQARLEHPNICRIYDIDVSQGAPRIAMQRVKGPTLEDASPELELHEVVGLVAQLAETLQVAHRAGLIHRDVKPGNVLLEWQEGAWNPVLCDFGLALAMNESSLTQPNALTGTPAYMAPEQVRGHRSQVGPPTDVYGLGGTLYFLLVGRPPCVSTVTREMLRVKREKRFPQPRALEPSIPEALEAVLLRCLAPDPADRYPTMEALARDLRAFLDGRPPRKPVPRVALLAAGLAAVLGVGIALAAQRTSHVRLAEEASRASMEAENLLAGLRSEREQPLHDLRPALARLQAVKAQLSRPGATSADRLVAGAAALGLGANPEARGHLEAAWRGGMDGPQTAYLLGLACAREALEQAQEAAFQARPPAPDLRNEAAGWFARAKGMSRDREAYAQALLAFLRDDLTQALAQARAAQEANPWWRDTTALGARCLNRLGLEALRCGDETRALEAFREALAWSERTLQRAPSDTDLVHSALGAALGLAHLQRRQGALAPESLAPLEFRANQALLLNPEAPVAQADWLSIQCLRALRLEDQGRDAGNTLQSAMTYFRTHTRTPRPPCLREAHMMLFLLLAKHEAARNRSAGQALAEALQDAGHSVSYPKDYFQDLQEFRADLELRPRDLRVSAQGPAPGKGRKSLLVRRLPRPRLWAG